MATEQPPEDILRRLERRLGDASAAAERLIAEAAASAAASAASAAPGASAATDAPTSSDRSAAPTATGARDKPPAAGWQAPSDGAASSDRDAELIADVLARVRDLIPPELQKRLVEALRELLLAVRALLDWYIERLERRRTEPVEIQDIPIT